MQARTRNLSTGEFEPKCAQRHHAIYASDRKYTPHFGSFSPVSVKTLVSGMDSTWDKIGSELNTFLKKVSS